MTATHIHLILNHLPILGVFLGAVLLGAGLLGKSDQLKKAALVLFVVCGLALVVVFQTGEPAEESVEHLPGVSESLIERHEDAARTALIATEVLAVASLGALVFGFRRELTPGLVVPVLALSLLASGTLTWTGNLGGQIRHSEIRTSAAPAGEGAPALPGAREGDHDDD